MEKRRAAQAALLPPPTTPALPIARYGGSYGSTIYGKIIVAIENGALIRKRPTATAVVIDPRANRFKARWTSASLLGVFAEPAVGFTIDSAGDVVSLELGTDLFAREDLPSAAMRR